MPVVETRRRPDESDEEWDKRQEEEHWSQVRKNERELLAARRRVRERLGHADSDG